MLRVALNEISDFGSRISGSDLLASGFGNFEHLRAEIEAGDFRAAPREGEGDVAGAAAQIERAIAGLNGGQFDHAAFPAPVQPEALQVVEQIVAPGDGGKKVVDLGRALFAGRVKALLTPQFNTSAGAKVKGHKMALRRCKSVC